ncbi:hypothetical protein [Marinobacter sp. MDS2]|uniref:hypothetical protein n=1 Tax=Marinobacter sp. MDS2 TaxID=3065961 RepID=UPI00273B8DBC|nr:hypothetical protein [Marinobacter sp. MDS2]MDP4546496.1 hypothetical protein [Marinobacter sp. MDS2]
MSIVGVDYTEITGLTATGATDGSGAWNTGIDLASFGVAAGATGAIILIENTSSSNRWVGLRDNGKANAHIHQDALGRYSYPSFVSLTGGLVDLYFEAGVRFFVLAYTDSDFIPFDVDGALPTQAHVAGVEQLTVANASVPLSATLIIGKGQNTWAPAEAGGALSRPYNSAGIHLTPLNEANEFYSTDSISGTILGYDTSPVTALPGTAVSVTSDGLWADANVSFPGASFVFGWGETSASDTKIELRAKGSAWTPNNDGGRIKSSTTSPFMSTPVNAAGEFETYVEAGDASPQILLFGYTGDPVPTPTVTLSADLQPGASFTLTYSDYDSAPVSPVTITDSNGNSITVAVTISDTVDGSSKHGGTATGTMPALPSSGTATGLLFGTVTIELGTV